MKELLQAMQDELKRESALGTTNKEMGIRAGCSQQRINQLIHDGGFEKVKLETLLKLFPNIHISLDGSPITATNSAVNAGVNNGNMTVHAVNGDAIKNAITSKLVDSDMCSDCIVKAIKIIKEIEL